MPSYLVAEEGPLLGLVICFEEGTDWVLGRDPEVSYQVLEDPMVSRKHAVCRWTDSGYLIENLSAINPTSVNGKIVETPVVLQEGDLIQIGNIFFRFTLEKPETNPLEKDRAESISSTIYEDIDDLNGLIFSGSLDGRWMIKVISGPNSGGEFSIAEGSTYLIGKDPNTCDIVFQDLSVSRQHAKIIAGADGTVEIEDLGSLNKVLVNGQEIAEQTELHSQDLIALGTTSFLIIDQKQTRETIISPSAHFDYSSPFQEKKQEQGEGEDFSKSDWKKMVIPTRHLVVAGLCGILLIFGFFGVLTLFKTQTVAITTVDETQEIAKVLKNFPEVEFSFNPRNGKLFVLGHVMTEIDHQGLIYALKSFLFVQSIEDNVIIDELVWENTNALLTKNSAWRGVNLSSMIPGHFILRGYVQTLEDAIKLSEYMNVNFPYLDKLENQVVVENTLEAQIEGILMQNQFEAVTFQLSNGELVLSGRVPSNEESKFKALVADLKKITGVRAIKNFVILSQPTTDIIDLSADYKVTGSSKYGTTNQYVVINGKILSVNGELDGMTITQMENNVVFLEKDGIKYKINYNQR